ncbi:MAG: tetratricopeptide repeat protein [Chitinophagales bacterium]|nr:tetratricopeptide repeat protein [Chitinophagales bacterium]
MKKKVTLNHNNNFLLRLAAKYPLRVILLLTVIAYANTLFNDYNLDDELVTRNHRLTAKGFEAIGDIFKEPYYKDAMGYAYEYRPIVLLTFAIEHQLFGESPFVSHTINLLLYLILLIILYKTLCVLLVNMSHYVAFAITLLYALHPIHTEVVASIKCRDELLALLLGLLSLSFTLKFIDTSKWYWVPLSLIMLILGCLSKQSAIPFAVLIPIALILTRNLSIYKLLLVSGLFSTAIYPVLNVNRPTDKLFFVLAAVFFSIFLFLLKNVNYRQLANQITNLASKKTTDVFTGVITLQSKIKLLKGHQKFEFKSIVFPLLLAIALTLLFQKVSRELMIGSLACCYAIAVFFLYKKQSLLYIFPFLLFLTVHFTAPKFDAEDIQNITGLMLLSMAIVSANKWEVISSLTLYLIFYITISAKSTHVSVQYIFYIPVLAIAWLYRSRYIVWVCLVVISLLVIKLLVGYYEGSLTLKDVITGEFSAVAFFTSAILINKTLYRWAVLLNFTLIIILIALNPTIQYKNPDAVSLNDLSKNITSTVEKNNVSVFPENTDRPLHFAEVPVIHTNDKETRLGTSAYVLLKYLQLAIVPFPMAFYYGFAEIKPVKIFEPLPALSAFIYLLMGTGALLLLRRYPIVSFGILFYVISISVFSSYFVYMPGMMADRNLFIPTVGVCIVLTAALILFSKSDFKTFDPLKLDSKWRYGIAILLVLYSITTIARNFDWKDDLTLFRRDIKYVDESSQAHNLLALHLMQHASKETNSVTQQQLATEALGHFKRAIEIYPQFFNVSYDIGRVYMFLNKPDSAIIAFENAVSIDSSTLPSIYLQLADLYLNTGKRDAAIVNSIKYINLKSADYGGYSKLSYLYFMDKKYAESIEVNKKAMANIPNLIDPYINIAYTFREMNRADSALYYLRLAEKIDPINTNVQQGIRDLTGIGAIPQR